MFLLRRHQAFTLLLMALSCCLLVAVYIVYQEDTSNTVYPLHDGLKSRGKRKISRDRFAVLPSGKYAVLLIECITGNAYVTIDKQKVPWRRMAAIAKFCSRRHNTDPGPVRASSFSRMKVSSTELRTRESLITRRIFRLLRLTRKPALQYIYSSLNLALALTPENMDNFDPLKYLYCVVKSENPTANPDLPRNQRRLGRKIVNLLRIADQATVQEVCKKLFKRFNVSFQKSKERTSWITMLQVIHFKCIWYIYLHH